MKNGDNRYLIHLTIEELHDLIKNNLREVMKETSKDPLVLTRKEAADFLKVSLPTIDELSRQGYFPAYNIGTRRLYLYKEVIEALPEMKGFSWNKRNKDSSSNT